MSLAEETRKAIRDRPALFDALRAGVLNHSAAARELDVEGDGEAIATALRRFAADLDAPEPGARDARVRMIDASRDVPLEIGDESFEPGGGDWTAIVATGEVDARALEGALGLLRTHDVAVKAAGTVGDTLAVVVPRQQSAKALRLVERDLDA